MKNGEVFVIVFSLFLILSFLILTSAQDNDTSGGTTVEDTTEVTEENTPEIDTTTGSEKAYECLEDRIAQKDKSSLSLEEAVFSTLALGSQSKLQDKIKNSKSGEDCWPSSSCTIKDTAQVFLAYNRIGKSTAGIKEWLLSKSVASTELTWFLQIDISNHIPSQCTISYDDTQKTISIGEDMKITGTTASCFTITSSGFWLKIKNSCLDKTFQISCEEDFITSLLYQKAGSSTIFISSETHSSASSGTTQEMVDSKCFKTGTNCDYEGTLWATTALNKEGESISPYLPYLLALSEDNKRLFPNTFLYSITQGDDQYSQVVQSQKQEKFWQAPSTKYNKFYDTSLAMLSLQGTSSPEADNSKAYLLGIQTPEGCWNNNNIRDTAFLLYAGWPKAVPTSSGGGGQPPSCSNAGYCESSYSCFQAQGQELVNYYCPGFDVCCSVEIIKPTCEEQSGVICGLGEECSGTTVQADDTSSCCRGTCEDVPTTNECEDAGGFCESSCLDSERQTSDTCDSFSKVCCIASSDDSEESSFLPWIITLSILILLVILGIIYRSKLQMFFLKMKSGKQGKGQKQQTRRGPPGLPPIRMPRRIPRKKPMSSQPKPKKFPARKAPPKRSSTDDELDETFKKLKEIGE